MLETIKTIIYKVAIYIRLSKEDVDRGYDESESIKEEMFKILNKIFDTLEIFKITIDKNENIKSIENLELKY